MSKFYKMIGRQFGNPHGFIGKICCKIMNVINKRMYKSVAEEIVADRAATILDVGYGNGYLLNKLYKRFGCNLYGIEISADMEELALRRNKKGVDAGKVKLQMADCCEMPFAPQSFDYVTTVNTVYFWSDMVKGLSEIYRVLRDGGTFYNVVYAKEWLQKMPYTKEQFKLYDEEDFIRLGEQVGFSQVQIKRIKKNVSYFIEYKK